MGTIGSPLRRRFRFATMSRGLYIGTVVLQPVPIPYHHLIILRTAQIKWYVEDVDSRETERERETN